MDSALAVALIEMIVIHGPTVALKLMQGLDTKNPTPEQIRALKVEGPKHYFEE